jgi:hypothetical protein
MPKYDKNLFNKFLSVFNPKINLNSKSSVLITANNVKNNLSYKLLQVAKASSDIA